MGDHGIETEFAGLFLVSAHHLNCPTLLVFHFGHCDSETVNSGALSKHSAGPGSRGKIPIIHPPLPSARY